MRLEKAAFHDTDIDTNTDILARILARMLVSVSVAKCGPKQRTLFL